MKMIVEVKADIEKENCSLEVSFDPHLELDPDKFMQLPLGQRHEQNLLIELSDLIVRESDYFKKGEGEEPEIEIGLEEDQ